MADGVFTALLRPFFKDGEPRWGGIIGGLIGLLPALQIANSVSSSFEGEGVSGILATGISAALVVFMAAWGGNQVEGLLNRKPDRQGIPLDVPDLPQKQRGSAKGDDLTHNETRVIPPSGLPDRPMGKARERG